MKEIFVLSLQKDSKKGLMFLLLRPFLTTIFRFLLLTCWQLLPSRAAPTSVHTVLNNDTWRQELNTLGEKKETDHFQVINTRKRLQELVIQSVMPEQDPRTAETSSTPTNFPFPWTPRSFCGSSQPAQGIMKGGFSRETLWDLRAGSKEQLPSSKMQPAMLLLQNLHPSPSRNSGFHLSDRTTSSSPLHTILEFKTLLCQTQDSSIPSARSSSFPSPLRTACLWTSPSSRQLLSSPYEQGKDTVTEHCLH